MLTLTSVRKAFGPLVAVDGLSLDVRPGEVFGLLGPNGAGKTTTISMAVGLFAPDRGRVGIGEHGAPTDPAVRAKIGVAPQALALYDDLTAEENLRFFASLYGAYAVVPPTRAGEVLERVGLTARRRDRVKTFSGGMKRRLNLGAALLHDPPMLLLDEPTAGVDPQSRNNILEMVAALRAEGRTVVYTTHYMEEAARVCDRVAIMDRGRLLALGTVDELVARHGGRSTVTLERGEVRERIATMDPLGELTRVLGPGGANASGADLTGVRVERPNLETVFLSLTGRSLRD